MKPESWPVAEEAHWKTWKFKEIVSDAVEQDNLRVRKELAAMQEKFSHHERLHECVKTELETEREHRGTLQKSLDTAYAFIRSTQSDATKTTKILGAVTRQRDRYKNIVRQFGQSAAVDMLKARSRI
jgi:DNA anti-recombination protein RmuC